MCGIAGIFLFNQDHIDSLNSVKEMTRVLAHRGPDDNGYFFDERVSLGHRRLSIIDLSNNARQPMFNEDESLALVFNGEIYNFKELRKFLEEKGHLFKSVSDSEVILHLYEEYGVECTKYLEGMFAFSIFDLNKKTLYLARDRVGEKPLYYIKNSNGFYFSSEIKSFFKLNFFKKKLSPQGIHAYFNNIQIPAPQTIFDDVKKLRPAHWLLLDMHGNGKEKPYWHVDCTHKTRLSLEDAKVQLNILLLDSVKKMLISDAPIGLLLSGGVDSSLLLALANKIGRNDLTTFTVGNDSKESEDQEYKRAKKIANQFNSKNYGHGFGSTRFNELIEAAKACDEPIGILEVFYMFDIFKKIKNHSKVVLTGSGADEIFGGYVSYNNVKKFSEYTSLFCYLMQHLNPLLTATAESFHNFSNWGILKNLFSNQLKKSKPDRLERQLLSESMKIVTYDNVLDAKLFMDLLVRCNHGISSIPDIGGMSHSVEVRSPFLHHKIIEFAATLPTDYKIKSSKNPLLNKFLLKELACDYLQKDDVYIQKYGYGYFINSYTLMKTVWRNDVENSIFDPLIKDSGFFNMKNIKTFWEEFLLDRISIKEKLVLAKFVMFCVWYKYNFNSPK